MRKEPVLRQGAVNGRQRDARRLIRRARNRGNRPDHMARRVHSIQGHRQRVLRLTAIPAIQPEFLVRVRVVLNAGWFGPAASACTPAFSTASPPVFSSALSNCKNKPEPWWPCPLVVQRTRCP